ncbi:MAG: hypothetical protein BWX75_01426 [Candidatus Cloacimonetes bacterium ADurb.Bin088]|nr:MAG: hypothetical protein BWX75_01426 [Candidatus Cloacimonetes bacterium ADurb.Bin088]
MSHSRGFPKFETTLGVLILSCSEVPEDLGDAAGNLKLVIGSDGVQSLLLLPFDLNLGHPCGKKLLLHLLIVSIHFQKLLAVAVTYIIEVTRIELVPNILQFLQLGLLFILTFLEQFDVPGIYLCYLNLDKLLLLLRQVLQSPGIILFHAGFESGIGINTEVLQIGEVVDLSLVSGLDSILLFGGDLAILLGLPGIQILNGLTFGFTAILSKLSDQCQPSLVFSFNANSLGLSQPGQLFH